MPDSALGNIAVKHIYWSENHFQNHSHHTLLPPKHPLIINDIGPPIALTMEVVIVSPLILGYKYEKLKERGGDYRERGREKFVESLCQPKVGNSSPQYK